MNQVNKYIILLTNRAQGTYCKLRAKFFTLIYGQVQTAQKQGSLIILQYGLIKQSCIVSLRSAGK